MPTRVLKRSAAPPDLKARDAFSELGAPRKAHGGTVVLRRLLGIRRSGAGLGRIRCGQRQNGRGSRRRSRFAWRASFAQAGQDVGTRCCFGADRALSGRSTRRHRGVGYLRGRGVEHELRQDRPAARAGARGARCRVRLERGRNSGLVVGCERQSEAPGGRARRHGKARNEGIESG